tara:strand:- start:330 stop:638 length:309 start_codon:yes stop_codon:yes gene_type:complete
MAKAKYINMFINEKAYEEETMGFYKSMNTKRAETGKNPPPFLYNKKYSPREDIVLKAGESYDVSLWFNERDGKRDSSIAIKPASEQDSKPAPFNSGSNDGWD